MCEWNRVGSLPGVSSASAFAPQLLINPGALSEGVKALPVDAGGGGENLFNLFAFA